MAAYRGKHSKNSNQTSDAFAAPEQHLKHSTQPANKTQPVSGVQPAASKVRPVSSTQPKSLRRQQGAQVGNEHASPSAFKHHHAVQATGKGWRHSKGKTLLIVIPIVIVLVAVVIGVVSAINSFAAEDHVEAGIAVTVTIPDGASTDEIANILKQANVISNTKTFITDVQSMNAEQSLKPGTYELETGMDSKALIDLLVAGPLANGTKLTIPEGLTVEQTAAAVENALGVPQSEFLARAYAADEYAAHYSFLSEVYNNSLEGYLYPKTYNIPNGSTADYVIRVMLDQFVLETSNLDLTYADEHGMNLTHIITIASLIEKESSVTEEKPLISSVIYNRLREGMRLQIDATVVYALGSNYSGSGVSYEDLEIESPYNTYKVDELPAGPICSPSIESIEAAAHPGETDYLYYVLASKEGYHTFCVTSEEFEAAKLEYNKIFGIE